MAERQRLSEAQRAQHCLAVRPAAGVSHEIRNPLGAIFLAVDLLEEELQQPSSESPAQIAQALLRSERRWRASMSWCKIISLVRVSQIQLAVPRPRGVRPGLERRNRGADRRPSITLQLEGLENLGQVAFHASTLRRAVLNLLQNALTPCPTGDAEHCLPEHSHPGAAPDTGYGEAAFLAERLVGAFLSPDI
jgi:signal transduction histidine kinase